MLPTPTITDKQIQAIRRNQPKAPKSPNVRRGPVKPPATRRTQRDAEQVEHERRVFAMCFKTPGGQRG